MTYLPTSEQVAVAWLKTVSGIPADKVATNLPSDDSAWAATGFFQVTVVGGSPVVDTPLYAPVVQVDAWAASPNSTKPPWGRAGSLAAFVQWGCYQQGVQKLLDFGTDFHRARLQSAMPVSEPRRIPDPASYARVQLDVQMVWSVVPR